MSISAREALDRARAPQLALEDRPAGDLTTQRLRLNGGGLSARLEAAVLGGDLTRTIFGASTLTLTIHDAERRLIGSDLVRRAAELEVDGLGFALVRVEKAGDELTLTFEDREVVWLRRYSSPRKAYRDTLTRAQFVLSLVREVREGRIAVYSPALGGLDELAGNGRGAQAARDARRAPGLARDAAITVKGQPADRAQIALLDRFLDVARSLSAPRPALVALVMALVQESGARNLTYGHSSSVGPLQLLDIHLGASASTDGGRRDVELVARLFLTQGFTGRGGAIALAGQGLAPAEIAAAVQGNRNGARDYAPWLAEAERTVDAYGGAGLAASGEAGGRYEFRRGSPGESETSWDAIGRLAGEVGWRRFMVAGTLYFVSDGDLFRSRPRMLLSEASPGVDWIDFAIDVGQPLAEATVTGRAERWAAPPGSVVELTGCGPADGRWLVATIRRPLYSADAAIDLIKPTPALPEPSASGTTGGGAARSADAASESSELVEVPAAIAQRAGFQIQARFLPAVREICERFGVRVSSAHRSASQNAAADGAPRSDHLCGAAADFGGPRDQLIALRRWASAQGFAYVDGPDVNRDGNHGDHTHVSFVRCGG